MTNLYSEDDVVTTGTRLTRSQLVRFFERDLVKQEQEADGHVFRRLDIARKDLATLAGVIDALRTELQIRIIAEMRKS